MAEREFTLDMSKARRRRKRDDRGRVKYWGSRYRTFLAAGFSEEEASQFANKGCSVASLRRQIRHRKVRVRDFMELWDMSREEAVERCAKDLKAYNSDAGVDELNGYNELYVS